MMTGGAESESKSSTTQKAVTLAVGATVGGLGLKYVWNKFTHRLDRPQQAVVEAEIKARRDLHRAIDCADAEKRYPGVFRKEGEGGEYQVSCIQDEETIASVRRKLAEDSPFVTCLLNAQETIQSYCATRLGKAGERKTFRAKEDDPISCFATNVQRELLSFAETKFPDQEMQRVLEAYPSYVNKAFFDVGGHHRQKHREIFGFWVKQAGEELKSLIAWRSAQDRFNEASSVAAHGSEQALKLLVRLSSSNPIPYFDVHSLSLGYYNIASTEAPIRSSVFSSTIEACASIRRNRELSGETKWAHAEALLKKVTGSKRLDEILDWLKNKEQKHHPLRFEKEAPSAENLLRQQVRELDESGLRDMAQKLLNLEKYLVLQTVSYHQLSKFAFHAGLKGSSAIYTKQAGEKIPEVLSVMYGQIQESYKVGVKPLMEHLDGFPAMPEFLDRRGRKSGKASENQQAVLLDIKNELPEMKAHQGRTLNIASEIDNAYKNTRQLKEAEERSEKEIISLAETTLRHLRPGAVDKRFRSSFGREQLEVKSEQDDVLCRPVPELLGPKLAEQASRLKPFTKEELQALQKVLDETLPNFSGDHSNFHSKDYFRFIKESEQTDGEEKDRGHLSRYKFVPTATSFSHTYQLLAAIQYISSDSSGSLSQEVKASLASFAKETKEWVDPLVQGVMFGAGLKLSAQEYYKALSSRILAEAQARRYRDNLSVETEKREQSEGEKQELQNRLSGLSETHAEMQQTLQSVQAHLAESQYKITSTGERMTGFLKDVIGIMTTPLNTAKVAREKLQEMLGAEWPSDDRVSAHYEAFNQQMSSVKGALEALQEVEIKLAGAIERSGQILTEVQVDIEALQEDLRGVQSEISSLKDQLQQAEAERARLERAVNRLQEKNNALEAENTRLLEENAQLKSSNNYIASFSSESFNSSSSSGAEEAKIEVPNFYSKQDGRHNYKGKSRSSIRLHKFWLEPKERYSEDEYLKRCIGFILHDAKQRKTKWNNNSLAVELVRHSIDENLGAGQFRRYLNDFKPNASKASNVAPQLVNILLSAFGRAALNFDKEDVKRAVEQAQQGANETNRLAFDGAWGNLVKSGEMARQDVGNQSRVLDAISQGGSPTKHRPSVDEAESKSSESSLTYPPASPGERSRSVSPAAVRVGRKRSTTGSENGSHRSVTPFGGHHMGIGYVVEANAPRQGSSSPKVRNRSQRNSDQNLPGQVPQFA